MSSYVIASLMQDYHPQILLILAATYSAEMTEQVKKISYLNSIRRDTR
jgi:hypothetical protein